jgi:hypothetical protein
MESGTFCAGSVFGFIVAWIIGVILGQIRGAQTRMEAQDRALDGFPDARQPTLTPAGIVRDSHEAQWAAIGWTLMLIIFVTALVAGVYFFALQG